MTAFSISNEQTDAKESNTGVASVERAFTILDAFDIDHPKLSLAELSRKTQLYKSTILRLMVSLEKFGYIHRGEDGLFSLGSSPLKLANIYQNSFNLKEIIHPTLQLITKESGETSSFYILQNDKRMILFRVEPERSVKVSISEGDIFPINVGAAGKILRAFSQDVITPELESIRKQAWAASFGERDVETSALSVPVFGISNRLEGALTLSGPIDRLDKSEINKFIPLLLNQSILISKKLGASSGFLETISY